MQISATYVCPVRGLMGLEPPEPNQLGQAAKVARSVGIERLLLPVLEESLLQPSRGKVHYLDELIQALDQVGEAKLQAWLITPAQRVLGLDFVPPHLLKGVRDPKAGPVFADGKIRNLWPFDWWADPSLIQKRIKIFREVVTAVSGHPAITGWVIMDRALEWSRPHIEIADLVLKSYMAEIRERAESESIYVGLGWSELLSPEMARALAGQVDGLRMGGLEDALKDIRRPVDLPSDLKLVSYLGTLAQWLFARPIEVETGWGLLDKRGDPEEIVEAAKRLAGQGLAGVSWLSLIDPEPRLQNQPPWVLKTGLDRVGLLDQGVEPKEYVETWLEGLRSSGAQDKIRDFIDVDPEEYLSAPDMHLPRMWGRFLESIRSQSQ